MAAPTLPILNRADGRGLAALAPDVVQYLQDLDRWVQTIDQQAVRYGDVTASGRTDPIYGPTILAGQIRNLPGSSKAGMSEDFQKQLGTVTDTNGVVRVQWGNLAANGISPAQQGFRANDAAGNPIFDSLGLISVMSQPATAVHNQTNTYTTNSTAYVAVTGATLTFTLARSTTMLFIGTTNCNVIGAGPGNWGYVVFNLDGTNHTTDATVATFSLGTLVTNASLFYSVALAAGSHTIALYQKVDNASVTIQNFGYDVFAFQLGG
jgi:hypothetical protein